MTAQMLYKPWGEAHSMSLARNIVTVGSGTLVSRVLAFIRDAAIAGWLGVGPFSEAFFAMLQVVNFFRRLLADGALNGAFVPIWVKLRSGDGGDANASRFTRRSLLVMLCMTGIAALILVVLAAYIVRVIAPGFDETRTALTTVLMTLAAPYIVLAGLVAVIAAALNAEGRVAAVTVSTVMFNVVMVTTVAVAIGLKIPGFEFTLVLSGAIVIAGLAQLLITGITWLATGKRWRRAAIRVPDQTGTLFTRAVPGLIAAGIPQLKLIAAAAIVSSSPAAVAWLYYANRLYELPLGIASIAVAAVIVPRIAATLRSGDATEFARAQSRAFEIALGLALPAATGFALLAQSIAAGLFQRGAFTENDTIAVAAALTAICAGLPGHVLEKVLGAISFGHEDTRTPMGAALGGFAVAVAGGLLLFPHFGYVGAAAAIAVSGWVGAALLGIVLWRRGWLRLDRDAVHRLPRIVLATLAMAASVFYGAGVSHNWPALAALPAGRLILLAGLVTLGIIIYGATLRILGVIRLRDIAAPLRHRS
jgi:putative peptidoglycan lipid II flippase